MLAALALFAIAAGFVFTRSRKPSAPATTSDRARTIAVLPFRNISQDTAQLYFSAGMTEEIASQLSRVGALHVLGRSATAQYEGQADRLQRMGSELGVGSVVEGSVRLAGNQVRIGVELTDVRTGQRLWSEQYDRKIDDVFAVQGDVARNVATALQATLTPDEAGRVGRVATRNMEAYRLYLRALKEKPFLRAGNVAQAALLQQAIQLDTSFAGAYAMLARNRMFRGVGGEPAYIDSGFVSARKAIALDPEEALGYFALGDLNSHRENYSEARRSYLKTLELTPGHVGAMADLANVYVALGRFDEALDLALRGSAARPQSLACPISHRAAPAWPGRRLGNLPLPPGCRAEGPDAAAYPGPAYLAGHAARTARGGDRTREAADAEPARQHRGAAHRGGALGLPGRRRCRRAHRAAGKAGSRGRRPDVPRVAPLDVCPHAAAARQPEGS